VSLNQAMDVTKRKLVLHEGIWRKEILKTRGSEDQKLTSLEAPSSEAVHRKLTSSEVMKIIRS